MNTGTVGSVRSKAIKLFEQVVAAHPGTPEATQADAVLKALRKEGWN